MLYTYKCIRNETVIKGQVEAKSLKNLRTYFLNQDMHPLFFYPSFLAKKQNIKEEETRLMIRQLSYLMTAGHSITAALNQVGQNNPRLKNIALLLMQNVSSGLPFSQAFEKVSSSKNHVIKSLLCAGESKGNLSDAFTLILEYLTWKKKHSQKIKNDLRYPLLLLCFMSLMIWGFFVFLIPLLKPIISSTQHHSWATKSVLFLHHICETHLIAWGAVLLSLILGWVIYGHKHPFQKEQVLLRLPFFGIFRADFELYRISKEISVLLKAGLSLRDTLKITHHSTHNAVFKRLLHTALQGLEKGTSLSNTLSTQAMIPPIVPDILAAGEQSNHLSRSFSVLTSYFQDALENRLSLLNSYAPPLLFLCMGAIIAWIFLGLFYPLYDVALLEQVR